MIDSIEKQKAKELVCIYSCLRLGEDFKKWGTSIVYSSIDKTCALIAVDLVLDEFSVNDEDIAIFWVGVKSEIRKL